MELQDFITQVLIDIVQGVANAQKKVANADIVPDKSESSLNTMVQKLTPLQVVEFEVCISVDESKGNSGKIGVVAGFINAGGGVNASTEKGHSTTVKFAVPVRLPVQRVRTVDANDGEHPMG